MTDTAILIYLDVDGAVAVKKRRCSRENPLAPASVLAAEPSAPLMCSAIKTELRRLGSAKVQLSPRGEISGVPVSCRDNNSVCECIQCAATDKAAPADSRVGLSAPPASPKAACSCHPHSASSRLECGQFSSLRLPLPSPASSAYLLFLPTPPSPPRPFFRASAGPPRVDLLRRRVGR